MRGGRRGDFSVEPDIERGVCVDGIDDVLGRGLVDDGLEVRGGRVGQGREFVGYEVREGG